jgi:hypothetical protein
VKRIKELPTNARKLVAWASLFSGSFSFTLIKTLMDPASAPADARVPLLLKKDCAVTALNATVAAYILMAADDEDRFRFSHDRYLTAAVASLDSEWDTTMMHYMISKLMISDENYHNPKTLYMRSRHICLATELIKTRETKRSQFRDVLYQAAETACESGARSTGMYYYTHCLLLLQEDPWNDDESDDVSYQETLQLFVRAAECYWQQNMFDEALTLIRTTFKHARDPCDMASSFILQSRVFAVRGDSFGAFQALKDCLSLLEFPIPLTTWEECDAEFQEICALLQSIDKEELLSRPLSEDRALTTMGPVAVELLSATFWSDSKLFYQSTLKLIGCHLRWGTVSQVALGYVHLGSIAGGRFNMIEFAIECGTMAKRLFALYPQDYYTIGRGQTLHPLFLGHLEAPVSALLPELEGKNS